MPDPQVEPTQNLPMTDEDTERFLGVLPTETKVAATNFPQIIDPRRGSLAPKTEQALDQQAAPGMRGFLGGKIGARHSLEEFRLGHQEEGTRLDISEGLPAWDRLMVEGRMNRANKLSYLAGKYGEDRVRMTQDGEIFVRIPDDKNPGKLKDIPISSPDKLTASDFIALSAFMPETAGWIAGERMLMKAIPKVAGRGIIPAAGRLAAGAIGAETTGALTKDVPEDLYDFGKIAFPDIAEQRGEQAGADVAIGAVGGFLRFMRNPFASNYGDIQFDRVAAGQAMQRKFGINPEQTIGEATGSPLFLRSEAFVEKEPGGAGPIRAVKARQEQQLRDLQNAMMGTRSAKLDEAVGAEAIKAIQRQVEIVNMGVDIAGKFVKQASQSAIQSLLAGLTSPDKNLYREAVGKEVREMVTAKRDAAKAEANKLFESVRAMPGGSGKVFSAQPLQTEYQRILDSLPSAEQTADIITGLWGPHEEALFTEETTRTPMREHLPTNLIPRLNEVLRLRNAKFSLSDLQQMRRDIYDDIARGEGVPGPPSHYLAEMGKAVTKAIEDSIASLPSSVSATDRVMYDRLQQSMREASREGRDIGPIFRRLEDIKAKYMGFAPADFNPTALKEAVQKANTFYKEKVVPFSRLGITEMFRAEHEPGFISNERIVNQLFKGESPFHNWQVVKDTLGEDSPTFGRIKRIIANNLIPFEPGDGVIDAKKMISNFADFKNKNPEIFKDIFSDQEQELIKQARYLQIAAGDKVDTTQLRNLLQGQSRSAQTLKLLIDAERFKTDLFRNQIVKAIGDGVVDETKLKPVEFVTRLMENEKFGVGDTKQLMALLNDNPQLQQDLRQKTFEKIFRDAARPATAADISRTARGDETHILSGVKLNQALKDKTYRSKVAEVLGKDSFEDLENYIKILAPLEQKEEAYALAGGLAAGSRIGQLERVLEGRGGLLRFAGNTARSFVFSTLLSNKTMRGWMSNVASPYDQKTLIMSILTSPPFIEAVAKEFPGASGLRFINEINNSVRRSVKAEIQQHVRENRVPPKTAADLGMAAKPMTDQDVEKYLGGKPTANNLLPAIRLMNGKVVKATPNETTHNDIISKNGLKATDIDQRGFVDPQGNFYDRESAAQTTGLETNVQPGRLHSTDLPRAKE